eukprot:Skav222717  [mRNA]  locus=scaffold4971:14341:14890:+ [translate_table: standard]
MLTDDVVTQMASQDERLPFVVLTVRRMNAALRLLYRGGAWLDADSAATIGNHGMVALRAVQRCAELSVQRREPRFPLHAKMHMLCHQFRNLVVDSQRCAFVESPLTDSCQQDETFVGIVARFSRRVSPRMTIHRTLDLYLTHIKKYVDQRPVQ